MKRKRCPYCDEEIAITAKKCRFCGEWLEEVDTEATVANLPAEIVSPEALEVRTATDPNLYPDVSPTYPIGVQTPQSEIVPGAQPGQTIQSIGGQPIVVNVVNQQSVEQTVQQEQTVIVESKGSSESAPGWIFTEMWLIAAGIGFALESWWWFLGIGLIGSGLLMVPFIGAAMCVLMGIGWGLLGAAIGAAIWGTSAAWVIGIIVSLGAIFGHLEARKANMEE